MEREVGSGWHTSCNREEVVISTVLPTHKWDESDSYPSGGHVDEHPIFVCALVGVERSKRGRIVGSCILLICLFVAAVERGCFSTSALRKNISY